MPLFSQMQKVGFLMTWLIFCLHLKGLKIPANIRLSDTRNHILICCRLGKFVSLYDLK